MWRLSREEILRVVQEALEKDRIPEFMGTDLTKTDLRKMYLSGANLNKMDLSGANLGEANLSLAKLGSANLSKAYLREAHLKEAFLHGANLSGANLTEANLFKAYLEGANLSGAKLEGANLSGANLSGADFSGATLGGTIFGEVDLSAVKGLDTVFHWGPSTIGIETLLSTRGQIPEVFLRGIGVPETLITYLPSLLGKAIEYYSCFISYSAQDTPFATRLHADLQQKGVRCWFAPEDLKIGAKIRPTIDATIRLHDKLLLVLSEHSVRSQWVEQEVETALARERKQDETVLFPVRLDNTVIEMEGGWPALIKNTRNIGDFRGWEGYEAYQKAFQRLLRGLKV